MVAKTNVEQIQEEQTMNNEANNTTTRSRGVLGLMNRILRMDQDQGPTTLTNNPRLERTSTGQSRRTRRQQEENNSIYSIFKFFFRF